jgi:hypothetical protein
LSTERAFTRIPGGIVHTSPLPIQSLASELHDEASVFVAHIEKAEILGKYDKLECFEIPILILSSVSHVVKLATRDDRRIALPSTYSDYDPTLFIF